MPVYKIKGHEKFSVREGWLAKGLIGVKNDNKVFSGVESTDKLGIGTNMVKALRYWMQSFNLIEESPKTGTTLSELGKIISDNDTYIEDDFTLWILHSNLAKNKTRATSWYIFFNLCVVNEFTKNEIFTPMKKELIAYAETDKFPDGSISDDIDLLLSMYSRVKEDDDPEDKNRSPFSQLGLLKKEGNLYIRQQPKMSRFSDYVILYELCHEFASQEDANKSISIDKVSELAYNIYNLTRISVNSILDRLDNDGYIRVDRTAGLDVIYPVNIKEPMEVIKEYYKNRWV